MSLYLEIGIYTAKYRPVDLMKISVITAVRNNRDTIAAALDSILGQTWPDIELVVIDGSSTDGTLEVLESYRSRINYLVSEKDQGIYDALNKGLMRATGDIIGFLHADDLLASSAVLATIESLFREHHVDGVYGDLVYVRQENPEALVRFWRSCRYRKGLLQQGWMPPHPTLYLRRRVYEKFGTFDTTYRIAADYDFILRIFKQGALNVHYIPQVLVRMRLGGVSNRNPALILRKSREDFRALRSNSCGGLWALIRKNLSKLPQFWQKIA
jgi:glycosyltransferase involved in cell wall biosynthesis